MYAFLGFKTQLESMKVGTFWSSFWQINIWSIIVTFVDLFVSIFYLSSVNNKPEPGQHRRIRGVYIGSDTTVVSV